MEAYNNWSNYVTWYMSMVVADLYTLEDFVEDCIWSWERMLTTSELSEYLCEMMRDIVFEDVAEDSIAYTLLDYIYDRIDFDEIADVMIDDAMDEYECRLEELRKEANEERKYMEYEYMTSRGV